MVGNQSLPVPHSLLYVVFLMQGAEMFFPGEAVGAAEARAARAVTARAKNCIVFPGGFRGCC